MKSIDSAKQAMRTLVMRQLVVSLIAIIILFTLGNRQAPFLLVGSTLWTIGTRFAFLKINKYQGATQAKSIIKQFYLTEVIKLLSVGFAAAIIASLWTGALLPIILGIIVAQVVNLTLPGLMPTNYKGNR